MMDHKFLHTDSLFYRPLRWLERTINRSSPMILTSSHNAKQALIADFGCSAQKILPVADCVDARTFHPRVQTEESALSKRRTSLGIPLKRRIIVYLGLLADYQGTDALLQAAANLVGERQDVHFLIMGFPAVEYYDNMARRLGIANFVTFTGKIPYHHARDFLALGDVAVAPKLSATEGSGKILNYMAMALPTVAFDTPVSREYLKEQGIYATPGDPVALAQGLRRALSNADAAHRGEVLRQRAVEAYSWDEAADTILQAYQSVC
jgi:glycosyltransferase involved in cell wall biosynthesis